MIESGANSLRSLDYYIHGFLGLPEDLGTDQVKGLDLLDLVPLEREELKSYLEQKVGNRDGFLFAYSMGGRWTLQNYQIVKVYFQKIFILSSAIPEAAFKTTPGLIHKKNIDAQLRFEKEVIQKLRENSSSSFLEFWNSLPLFQNDLPLSGKVDFDRNRQLYHLMRPSRYQIQSKTIEDIKQDPKLVFVCGELDSKYSQMYRNLSTANPIEIVKKAGHRINTFENYQKLKYKFSKEEDKKVDACI